MRRPWSFANSDGAAELDTEILFGNQSATTPPDEDAWPTAVQNTDEHTLPTEIRNTDSADTLSMVSYAESDFDESERHRHQLLHDVRSLFIF